MASRPMGLVRTAWDMFNQHGDKVLHMEGYGMFRGARQQALRNKHGLQAPPHLAGDRSTRWPSCRFFIHYTQGFTREQRLRTIWISSFSVFTVIAISALLGLQILSFFGISLASFQVGGGMLLLTSALSMLNAQPPRPNQTSTKCRTRRNARPRRASIAVVPLTIPLLTGPATMSTVVIYADKAKTFLQLGTLVGYGVVIALATALCFALAQPIAACWARPAST